MTEQEQFEKITKFWMEATIKKIKEGARFKELNYFEKMVWHIIKPAITTNDGIIIGYGYEE